MAFARVGDGPPLLRTAHWLGHLEYDWELPIFRGLLLELASSFSLVRYDARGNGLSDWDVGNLSLDVWVSDMETVADAAGLEKFPILALSQGCAVAIAFAIRYPERVSHLILYGGFAAGAYKSPEVTAAALEQFDAMKTLMKLGWGANEPTFRQLFTASMMPDATKEQIDAFNEAQRISASAECAVRYLDTVANFDVRDLLPQIKVPTLVMHVRNDRRVPIAASREMAAAIPGARLVTLPGRNHILLEQDPGVPIILDEIRRFLGVVPQV
nr:alpha/beta hydrolase [Bradyrhizobium sp. G127]